MIVTLQYRQAQHPGATACLRRRHPGQILPGVQPRQEAYDCIADTLRRFHYELRRKADKGLITRFLCQVTGLSRQQVVRHIRQFRETRQVQDRRGAPAKPFARHYTDEDVHLLALGWRD